MRKFQTKVQTNYNEKKNSPQKKTPKFLAYLPLVATLPTVPTMNLSWIIQQIQ